MSSSDKNEINIKEENIINENEIKEEHEDNNNFKEDEETYEEGHYPKKEYEYVHDFEWNEEFEKEALEIIKENNDNMESFEEFIDTQSKNWEKFYKFNKTNFFKDRHYILEEFQELKNDKINNKTS